MKKMPSIIALLFTCLFTFCHAKKQPPTSSKKGFNIKAKVGNGKKKNGINYLAVRTILINNSADTIRYINFSCSWDMCYVTDNYLLQTNGWDCDKNYPQIFTILPFSNDEERVIQLRTKSDSASLNGVTSRVGFNYVPFTNRAEFDSQIKKLDYRANLIWSDTLLVR